MYVEAVEDDDFSMYDDGVFTKYDLILMYLSIEPNTTQLKSYDHGEI